MTEERSIFEANPSDLLKQLEHLLESDPLIDEVGLIHPSLFVTLSDDAVNQSGDKIIEPKASKTINSDMVFYTRDHKLGISTQVLLPLYNVAKHAFMDSLARYKMVENSHSSGDRSGNGNNSCCSLFSLNVLESEVMNHSRVLLLLSCDFGTAWNARKLVVSKKKNFSKFVDELLLSALVLSYYPKSECAWSHRRWVIKMIAGKCSNLQDILGKESELVEKKAEKSKMNYRAWNHRCWLVSYMSRAQVLHELNKSQEWAGLHVGDNSCFHYRTRLMLRVLEESWEKHESDGYRGYDAELYQLLKEELDWDETLIKRYIGREALWLHRRFLSLCFMKHFVVCTNDAAHYFYHNSSINDVDLFMNNELQLFRSCSTIPDDEFEDYQSQAMFSATYIMWLAMQIYKSLGIELEKKLQTGELDKLLNGVCPEKTVVWNSIRAQYGSL